MKCTRCGIETNTIYWKKGVESDGLCPLCQDKDTTKTVAIAMVVISCVIIIAVIISCQ